MGVALQRRADRAAAGVAQQDHQRAPQVLHGVLYAAQLLGIQHVARHADDEQLAQRGVEQDLRDDPGVGAGDDDGVGALALFGQAVAQGGVGAFDVAPVARVEALEHGSSLHHVIYSGALPVSSMPRRVSFNRSMSTGLDRCAFMPAARHCFTSSSKALADRAMIGMAFASG